MVTGGLESQVGIARSGFGIDVPLEVAPGEVVALLGPNGAGKTTVLRALAGLLRLSSGMISLDGVVLDLPGKPDFVPPAKRRAGVVFQDYLLFPHLSALENVAFGLRAQGVPRGVSRARAREWLARVGLPQHAGTPPSELSGGQSQRVALARALATEPALLLLDEPLAALDASTRVQVRSELRRHLGQYPGATVLVTHDALDAMVLADRVVVIERGQVVQTGAPAEVARTPKTEYVARLVGLNLYRGEIVAGSASGSSVTLGDGGQLTTGSYSGERNDEVFVAVAPSSVALYRNPPGGSPRNVWRARVTGLEQHGDVVRVALAGTPPVLADVTTAAVAELDLVPGAEVFAVVKATEVRVYPA
jgi:molybdate transport system ATP-binding protein